MAANSSLLDKIATFPQSSGCYLMQDSRGAILYVGKAKNLRSRVRSYFSNSNAQSGHARKNAFLLSHVIDISFMLTSTEAESLVLENNLIKKHSPKYNIRLKDDKTYPYLVVDYSEPFPRIKYMRRPRPKAERLFFGPYPAGSRIGKVLRVVNKLFMLRDCTLREMKQRKRPCLLYQMRQCSAPCVDKVSASDYEKTLSLALDLFRGKRKAKQSIDFLKSKMHEAAELEEFEYATTIRDSLLILEEFLSHSYDHQNVEFTHEDRNIDIMAYCLNPSGEIIDIALSLIRNGQLLGNHNLHFNQSDHLGDIEEGILALLFQHYQKEKGTLPEKMICELSEPSRVLLESSLSHLSSEKTLKVLPVSKKFRPFYQATLNQVQESQRVRLAQTSSSELALQKLSQLLNLKENPKLLECYDVAIWQGRSPTASQVVFHNGVADKSSYRYYHLETRDEGNNDFAMMQELVGRRIKKATLPDVMIVDGGKGQRNAVEKILAEHSLEHIPVVGIAKARAEVSRSGDKLEERLFLPNRANAYLLKQDQNLFRLLVSMRDEAHRFSRKLHHKAEHRRIFSHWIEEVSGLSAKSRAIILENLEKSPEELKKLSSEDLETELKISSKAAALVTAYLKSI